MSTEAHHCWLSLPGLYQPGPPTATRCKRPSFPSSVFLPSTGSKVISRPTCNSCRRLRIISLDKCESITQVEGQNFHDTDTEVFKDETFRKVRLKTEQTNMDPKGSRPLHCGTERYSAAQPRPAPPRPWLRPTHSPASRSSLFSLGPTPKRPRL